MVWCNRFPVSRFEPLNPSASIAWPPLPDYGCFLRWPEDGYAFIHPDDQTVVRRCLPSGRVLQRYRFDGTFYHYRYGRITFRLRPAMWLKIAHEGIDVGDRIETIGPALQRDHFVARVWGMHYVPRKGRILYRLRMGGGEQVPRLYSADELRVITEKKRVRQD